MKGGLETGGTLGVQGGFTPAAETSTPKAAPAAKSTNRNRPAAKSTKSTAATASKP